MTFDIERVADTICEVGEGPLWCEAESALYWADIARGDGYRYDPERGDYEHLWKGSEFGGYTIQADGALLLFGMAGQVSVRQDDDSGTVVDEIPAERDGRFNDVLAGPDGQVFAGTVSTDDHSGRLYRVDPDGSYEVLDDGFDLPNGMGFSPDRETLYVTDTGYFRDGHDGRIYAYDYDAATATLSNRHLFVDADDAAGYPDGMTVDAEGHVWSAHWDGGCLVRYAPDGREVDRVEFPTRKVSSAVFGGEEYRDLYVTTAGGEDRDAEGPGAGALFRVDPGVSGLPEFRSRVGL